MYLWDTFEDAKIDISVKDLFLFIIYKQLKFPSDEAKKRPICLRFSFISSDKLNCLTWYISFDWYFYLYQLLYLFRKLESNFRFRIFTIRHSIHSKAVIGIGGGANVCITCLSIFHCSVGNWSIRHSQMATSLSHILFQL